MNKKTQSKRSIFIVLKPELTDEQKQTDLIQMIKMVQEELKKEGYEHSNGEDLSMRS
jgi:hypothetical protein